MRQLHHWLDGGDLPRHHYRPIATVEQVYQRIRARVLQDGLPAEDIAVPVDVQGQARARWSGGGRPPTVRRPGLPGSEAAEDGRAAS
eukprot:5320458-Lingulodinium_polyedra.AAC.1